MVLNKSIMLYMILLRAKQCDLDTFGYNPVMLTPSYRADNL